MIVGIHSSTHSKLAVIGGIIAIAIADAFSDAVGIHISEESADTSTREIWESTISTFFSKFAFALTFVTPILLLELSTAVIVSVAWGLSLITVFSFYLARQQGKEPHKVVLEHLLIVVLVIVATHYVGSWIASII